jgi:LuxR family maltose regulon positive regulatory protein
MIGAGHLHEAQQLTQQAIELGTQPGGLLLPDVSLPTLLQADILRECNELNAALSLVEEALSLCKQASSLISLIYSFHSYAVLLRIYLSQGDLDAARSALQQVERISRSMNLPTSIYLYSFFTTIDQIRLWLACGELKRATHWAETLDVTGQHGTPFAREREKVACVRLLLAKEQPTLALERLEPILVRATTGQRWDHVIEIRLLQALAHQMCQEETQALGSLSEAVRLAEPEGYIRRFIDEGALMAILLSRLREDQRKHGPTPYLDTLLAAFPQQSKKHARSPKQRRQERCKSKNY